MQSTMANEDPGATGTTSLEKFTCKVNDIIQKGYKYGVVYDFAKEIKLSLSFYKLSANFCYITVKAILTLPVFDKTKNFIITLEKVLNFFKKSLHFMLYNHTYRTHCLQAIEECCIECDHLKSREVLACIIQFFLFASILDRESVLDYHDELCEKDSPFVQEKSYKVTIGYLENGAEQIRGPGFHIYWSFVDGDDDDDETIASIGPDLPFPELTIGFVGDIDKMNGHTQEEQMDVEPENENPVDQNDEDNIGPARNHEAAKADADEKYFDPEYQFKNDEDWFAEWTRYDRYEEPLCFESDLNIPLRPPPKRYPPLLGCTPLVEITLPPW